LLRGLGPVAALPLLPAVPVLPRGLVPATRAASLLLSNGHVSGTSFTLANGVLSNMFFNKCKAAAAVALVVGVLAAAGMSGRTLFAQPPAVPPVRVAFAPAPENKVDAVERSAKMHKLLRDREAAALTEFNHRYEQFEAGRGNLDDAIASSLRILHASLELGPAKKDRIAAREAHMARIKKMLDINQARFDVGRASIADVEQTRYYYLDAEIDLEREKAR
jgi:hypothetical protein